MRALRLAALLALVLLLGGCAGAEEPGEGAAPTVATSGVPSEEPAPPPSEEPAPPPSEEPAPPPSEEPSAPPSEEPSAPPPEEAVSPDEVPGAVTVDAEGTVAEVVAGSPGGSRRVRRCW